MSVTHELTSDDLFDRSPFLLKLSKRRLAPSRLAALLAAARSSKPPREPDPWDCCGSSCKPCVRELWREEKRVWGEVHPEGEDEHEHEGEEDTVDKGKKDERARDASPKVEIEVEMEGLALGTAEDKVARATGEHRDSQENDEVKAG
ncbi:hypothetical protein JCM5296_003639 [Sporobolomyces johnsonii]